MENTKSIEIGAETSEADLQARLSELNPVYSSHQYSVFADSLNAAQTTLFNALAESNLVSLTLRNQRFPFGKACAFCKHLVMHGDVDVRVLQQAVEDVALVSLQIQQPEKVREYQPMKSTFIKVVREALYPSSLVEFALQLKPDNLETLKINCFQGQVRQYSYLLQCRSLTHLELPFFADDPQEITGFIVKIFANNPRLQQIGSQFGELLYLRDEGLGFDVGESESETFGHSRYTSHIRTFSQQVLDADYEEVKQLESRSDDEFDQDMLRAKEKLALVRQAQLKASEVLDIYWQLALRGILGDDPALGITLICITPDKKHILFYSAKERGPQYVANNKDKMKPQKLKISHITEYYSGNEEEPMNHQFLTLNCGKAGYRFKIRDFPEPCHVDTQDHSIAFVEVLRHMYGLEVLYGNIICKYLNRKYPGRFELIL